MSRAPLDVNSAPPVVRPGVYPARTAEPSNDATEHSRAARVGLGFWRYGLDGQHLNISVAEDYVTGSQFGHVNLHGCACM